MKKSILIFIMCLACMSSTLWATEAYVVKSTDGKTLTFYYDDNKTTREGTIYNLRTDLYFIHYLDNSITTVIFDSSFAGARPTSTRAWFLNMAALINIEDIQYLNTSEVTDMSYMFYGCKKITNIDLSNFETSKVTDMSYMFYGCEKITNFDLSNFETSKVTNMTSMFYNCRSITQLDLSNFNTHNLVSVTGSYDPCSEYYPSEYRDYVGMFEECINMESINLRNFSTSNITNMRRMFYRCLSLKTLDLSSFNTSNVTDMGGMFYGCKSLEKINLESFDTEKVINFTDTTHVFNDGEIEITEYGLFEGCISIKKLDVTIFNTNNATNMGSMFARCSSLTDLNVTRFNTNNVTNMRAMFSGCSGLKNLDVSNFNTQNVTSMSSMFSGCSGLTSLDVSNFDVSKILNSLNTISFMNCSGLTSLQIPSSLGSIGDNACNNVGTETNPCLINLPDGFDFGVDTSGDYFVWKGGYFTLGKQEYEGMMGDVNNDGVVSISDAICIISWLQDNTLPVFIEGAADYNKDGSITVSDALAIIRTLLNEEDEPATHIGEAIDLGLPSGLKWASYNVGATSPEEIGGYYAWGETEEKNGSYDESTYNYYHSSFDNLGANISGTNYDVAHIKWGGTWRMPTKNEFDELIKHCSLKYSTLNNVNGITFVGPNGNSIFLPTAGFRRFQGSLGIHNGEKWGYYWTSTQSYYQYEYCAYNLFINYQSYAELQLVRGFRTKGLLVRPVTE